MVSDPMVMPLAREMLDCLIQEIAKVPSPPQYVQLRPGTQVDHLLSVAEDECCAGLAWVRPVTFFPTSADFPAQDSSLVVRGNNPSAWAVTLELGAIRCAPTPEAEDIPTAEQWETTLQGVMDDAAAMRRAICCFIDARSNRPAGVVTGQWTLVPIQGGCSGGTISVTIKAPPCDCADAGPES